MKVLKPLNTRHAISMSPHLMEEFEFSNKQENFLRVSSWVVLS
jgi:hypothetical protein